MANRDPYRAPVPLLYCHCGMKPGLVCAVHREKRIQIRRARHAAASTIANELDQHASGVEADRFEEADWGPEEDPWQACWGEYAEPVAVPEPFATLADVA